MTGIHACQLLYTEYAHDDTAPEDDEDDAEDDHQERVDDAFRAAVRARAARDRGRLL